MRETLAEVQSICSRYTVPQRQMLASFLSLFLKRLNWFVIGCLSDAPPNLSQLGKYENACWGLWCWVETMDSMAMIQCVVNFGSELKDFQQHKQRSAVCTQDLLIPSKQHNAIRPLAFLPFFDEFCASGLQVTIKMIANVGALWRFRKDKKTAKTCALVPRQ